MSARKRFTAMASIAAVAGLLLTGCASGDDTGDNNKDAVSKLAVEAVKTEGVEVAGVWEWRDGYSVLLTYDNDYAAFGYLPDGSGSWDLDHEGQVSDSYDPETSPQKAACLTLAETETEKAECAQIAD